MRFTAFRLPGPRLPRGVLLRVTVLDSASYFVRLGREPRPSTTLARSRQKLPRRGPGCRSRRLINSVRSRPRLCPYRVPDFQCIRVFVACSLANESFSPLGNDGETARRRGTYARRDTARVRARARARVTAETTRGRFPLLNYFHPLIKESTRAARKLAELDCGRDTRTSPRRWKSIDMAPDK